MVIASYFRRKFLEPQREKYREQVREQGRKEMSERWREWNQRRLDAEAKGEDFDEALPSEG